MGKEVDTQNKHIERIQNKVSTSQDDERSIANTTSQSEKVDDGIAMNRARLDRISRRG